MSVLDVEKVLDQTIASQRLYKVRDGCFPVHSEDLTIYITEASLVGDLLQVADSLCVINKLDETTVRAVRDDGVWSDPDLDVFFGENLVDEGNQLHGHVLLPEVIARFDHIASDPVTGYLPKNRFLCYFFLCLEPCAPEVTARKYVRLCFFDLSFFFSFVGWRLATFYPTSIVK